MSYFFLVSFLILSPYLILAVGQASLSLMQKSFKWKRSLSREDEHELPVLFVFGLLVYLYLAFLLKFVSLPWAVACFAPLLLIFTDKKSRKGIFEKACLNPDLNFGLWFLVVLGTGVSLFEFRDEITTPWRNNYADLTFHLGMISSFVFSDNIPAQYHIYAGETLSYPFMINFWSALVWWISSSWNALAFIFLFQWVILWTLVYLLLNGRRFQLLPWALFFGGGSYFIFGPGCESGNACLAFGQNSGSLIGKNVPWTVFLTTIWVPQRSALFGVVASLCALRLFHSAVGEIRARNLLLSGLILSASFLLHTHITLFAGAYIGICLLIEALCQRRVDSLKWYLFGLIPSLLNLFWLLGKAGTMKFIWGWSTGPRVQGVTEQLLAAVMVWLQGAGILFLLVAIFWGLSKRHVSLFALAILFIIANVLQLAIWEWDQIKVFLALYVIFLSVWASSRGRELWWLHFFFIVAMIPALVESILLIKDGPNHTVFSKQSVRRASMLRSLSTADSVVAAAPDHNSPVTISGRRLFYGYEGTLHSHGIEYAERRTIQKSLRNIAQCRSKYKEPQNCPDFVFWNESARRYWAGQKPQQYFDKTASPFVWKVREGS